MGWIMILVGHPSSSIEQACWRILEKSHAHNTVNYCVNNLVLTGWGNLLSGMRRINCDRGGLTPDFHVEVPCNAGLCIHAILGAI